MKRLFLLIIIGLPAFFNAYGQALYMPRDVKQAFKNDTRSPDGKPGKNYWQNFGHYDITLSVMPPDRNISGSESIIYYNNSPDKLDHLVFKLFLNTHKPGALRFGQVSPDYLTSGIHIDSFAVNGAKRSWEEKVTDGTWKEISLTNALMPGDSVKLAIAWHYQISLQSGREGMIDSTTFFIAYFYPRVAVYDDDNGWDMMNFTGAQEFYSDFNDYTLTVNTPKNYIVWATGLLQNPGEVLQPAVAEHLQQSMQSDSVFHLADAQQMSAKNITLQNAVNTWKWKANYVPDVTLAISDHYNWDASSVVVDDATNRRASVQAAYNDTAKDFHSMVSFGKHALDWLSHNWPGVPYPYPKTTIVQGYAGMEYPMMANDESYRDTVFARFVAEHELAHTWFPFYMGINETKYGFMDEGWATTFELLIGRKDISEHNADEFYKRFRITRWIHNVSAEAELPIITPGNILSGAALGNNEYGKPSLGYLAVKDMLGDEMFRKCLHAFIDRWHGKHPIPWDFFNTFNDISGQNLNWFWNNWYFTNSYIDLAIQDVTTAKNSFTVMVKNTGGFDAPFDIIVHYADGSTNTVHENAEVWKENSNMIKATINSDKKVTNLKVDGSIFMDANESDNYWENP